MHSCVIHPRHNIQYSSAPMNDSLVILIQQLARFCDFCGLGFINWIPPFSLIYCSLNFDVAVTISLIFVVLNIYCHNSRMSVIICCFFATECRFFRYSSTIRFQSRSWSKVCQCVVSISTQLDANLPLLMNMELVLCMMSALRSFFTRSMLLLIIIFLINTVSWALNCREGFLDYLESKTWFL